MRRNRKLSCDSVHPETLSIFRNVRLCFLLGIWMEQCSMKSTLRWNALGMQRKVLLFCPLSFWEISLTCLLKILYLPSCLFSTIWIQFFGVTSQRPFFCFPRQGMGSGKGLQKSYLLPVCSKPLITHLRETWIIYFRAVQAWVSGGIPQSKHSNHQKFLLFVHFSKLRN